LARCAAATAQALLPIHQLKFATLPPHWTSTSAEKLSWQCITGKVATEAATGAGGTAEAGTGSAGNVEVPGCFPVALVAKGDEMVALLSMLLASIVWHAKDPDSFLIKELSTHHPLFRTELFRKGLPFDAGVTGATKEQSWVDVLGGHVACGTFAAPIEGCRYTLEARGLPPHILMQKQVADATATITAEQNALKELLLENRRRQAEAAKKQQDMLQGFVDTIPTHIAKHLDAHAERNGNITHDKILQLTALKACW
jgi:hypothetical protein